MPPALQQGVGTGFVLGRKLFRGVLRKKMLFLPSFPGREPSPAAAAPCE